ncbi:MAG: GNAT family N-acetyltransferase [Candidatus Hodarchaeota archaeon]
MRKRTVLIIFFVIIPVSIQLFGIPYLGVSFSSHDIEFNYVYNWNLRGIDGWYEGYKEFFKSNGHYTVDFSGNVATVNAEVDWKFISRLFGYVEESYGSYETYTFSYSLTDGSYLSGTDQDYDTSGMNVWFHIPQGLSASQYSLLNSSYIKLGSGIIWVGHLMPFTGIKLHDSGEYFRDDIYGEFDATYTVDNYFTQKGHLIGEIYNEHDVGYDFETGYYSEFLISSYVFITSASYLRPFNFAIYFMAYWFHILFFLVLFYVVYEHYRWKPIILAKTPPSETIIIEKKLPRNLEFNIKSAYSVLIPTFLVRGRSYGKLIVTAHTQEEIKGIGFIERNGKVGTFYGTYAEVMIQYAKVKYAFTEINRVSGFKLIEKYDVFQIENLQYIDLNYDASLIKPVTNQDLPELIRMIAYEDYGKAKKKYAKWVLKAVENDIALIATASPRENWTRDIMSDIHKRRYPKPQILLSDIIIGMGFATPGKNTGWLYGLYVHPAFRNQGIGSTLVKARLSALKEMGCDKAITEIAEWNGPAKKIYNEFDAQIIGDINLLGKRMPKVRVRRF